jgi:hypothetical protein
MPVKPASEMDDETFRKHLEIRHASLASNLARLESIPKSARRGPAKDAEALRGHRNLHAAEHRLHARGEDTGARWESHQHRTKTNE